MNWRMERETRGREGAVKALKNEERKAQGKAQEK